MAEFLHDLNIHGAGQIQFKTTAGANAGKIDQNGNDLVLSNAVGDIIIGNGSDDVYIGDGTNAVDIRFEQNMAIYADSSSTRTLTLGGANTTLNLENPNINGSLSLSNKLTFTGNSSYILFDYEPSTGSNAEYTNEVPLLKVDKEGTEKVILSRLSNNGALAIGIDDTVAIVAGDTKSVIKANHNYANENIVFASEGGFTAYGFPNNDTSWSNRNVFQFSSTSTTASNNGLYLGDGGATQFIDINRNLVNIGTISSGAITATDYRSSSHIYLTSGDSWIFRSTGGTERARFKSNGYLGIGTTNPDEKLHVMYAHADGAPTQYSKAVIEDTDAQLDILSTSDGTWGSSINLVEAAGSGANTDVWAMARKTTGGSGDSSLNFNFGTSNLHSNTTRVGFSSTGNITATGHVSATEFRPTNIVTNKVVKFNGTQLDDANITDTGSLITLGSNTTVSGELEATSLDINGNADIAGELQVTTNGTATLILRGDNNNSGDTGQLDSAIKMLHDDGTHGILMETKNYAGKQSFEIKSLSAGTESSRFLIHQDNYITTSGDILPQTDNSKDLGSSSYRWQNVVAVNLHGDGSNITNVSATDSTKLPLAGGTMTGDITMSNNRDIILSAGSITSDGTTFAFDGAPGKEVLISSARDVRVVIDDNDDDTDNTFEIHKHSFASGNELLTLNQSGNLVITGSITTSGFIGDTSFNYDTDSGNDPFYITRSGGTSQALSIKVMDDNVRFESIQDESSDDYGGFDFRMDSGTTEPDFIIRKGTAAPLFNLRGDGNATIAGNITLSSRITFDYGGDHYLESGTDTWNFKNSSGTTALQIDHSNQSATFAGDITIGSTSSSKALKLPNNGEIQLFNTNDDNKFTIRNIGSAQNTFAIETNDGTDALTISSTGTTTVSNLTVTGDLSITGDINSYNVTDLDVEDKTITVGVGQTAANSGSSGLIIDRSDSTNPSLLWNQTDGRFEFNSGVNISGQLHTTGSVYAKGALYVIDTDGTNNHIQARSNGTEGFLTVSNGSNWGFIVRGPSNDPRIGAYHGGTLKIEGFHSSDGATGVNAVDLAQFKFADAEFNVNGDITLTGTVDGVDIAARDAVLTSTTNTANAAAPKASPTFTGDLTIPSKIMHTGDTHTYMQFEANDVWRVVTGGTERLDINTNRILVGDDMNMNFDGISGGNVDGNNVQQSGNSGTVVYGGFLNPASEANMVHIPHIINDLAGFNRWSNATITTSGFYKSRSGSSGSYTYSNEVQANDSGWANAFDAHSSTAGSWYSDNGSDGVYQHGTDTPGVVELEWTNEATYSLWAGIVFGSGSFTATYVKIEAYRAGAWQTLCEITDNTDQVILRQVSGNSGTNAATRRLRYTLGGSVNNSYFRIHSLYMVNYAAGNLNLNNTGTDTTRGVNFLERYKDGYLHGHLRPGKDDTYDFGSSSYKWKDAYFDGVVVSDRVQSQGVFPQHFIIDAPNGGGNSRTMQLGMSGSSLYFKKSDTTGSVIFRNSNNTNLLNIGLADNGQVTVLNELEAGSLDINGNADISGTLDTGKLSVSTASDAILTLNQTSTDNKWNYINFNNQGTREWFIGQDSDGNFDLYNDNIDAYAITVNLSNNSILLNDTVTVAQALNITSGDVTLSAGNIIVGSQYGIRFNDSHTRIYTNTDNPEDLIIEADQDLLLTPDGQVSITGNLAVSGTVDGVDISGLPTFTTVGTNFAQLGNVSVASYIRINADETLSYLNAAQFLSAIGGIDGSAYLPLAGGTMTGAIDFGNVTGRAITITADSNLDSADASIYLGNSPSSYGWDIKYIGTGSGNDNKLQFISTNQGSPATALSFTQDGNATFGADVTIDGGDLTVDNVITKISGGSFRIKNSGGTTIATFANGGTAHVTGNFGVGGSPSVRLDVNAGTTNTVALFESTDDKAFIRIKDDDTDTHLISKDGHFSIGDSSSDYDNFKINITNGNATFAGDINTSGNIYLNNNKTIFAKNTSGSNFGLLTITSGNIVKLGAYSYTSAATQIGLGDNGKFLIGTDEALSIDSSKNATFAGTITSGNITATGSGNTALSVVSTGGYSQLITQASDSDSAYIFFKDTSGERARLYSSTSNDLIFKTGGGSTTALTLNNSGNATFAGNATVTGNLTVNGTTTTINTSTLTVEDPLISMAKDNSANSLDIGFYGKYNDGTNRYLGLFSNASDENKFVLFKGLTEEPTTTVNVSGTGFARGSLLLDSIGATGSITVGDSHFIGDDSFDNLHILASSGENVVIQAPTNNSIYLKTAGGSTLQLDENQNATFAGDIAVAGTVDGVDISALPTSFFDGDYGSLDNVPTTFAPAQHTQAFSTITSRPTTLSGYGITDAATSAQGTTADNALPKAGGTMTGDLTINSDGLSGLASTSFSNPKTELRGFIAVPGPETSRNFVLPGITENKFAGAHVRSGYSISVTKDGSTISPTLDNAFLANDSFSGIGSLTSSTVIVITIGFPGCSHGSNFGITFSNTAWRAKDVKIERSTDDGASYTTIYDITDSGRSTHMQYSSTGSTATNKVRYTLTDFVTNSIRISQIIGNNYIGGEGYFLQLYKGNTVYGNINPGTNNAYDLGTSSVKWRNILGINLHGDLVGTINTATTAATQSASDNSTKVATTAFVTTAVGNVTSSSLGAVAKAGDTMTGDLIITHANQPTLEIIDTTNDVDFRFRAANSYATIEADRDNDADSTRIQMKVDNNLVHEFLPSSQIGHGNFTIRKTDSTSKAVLDLSTRKDHTGSGNFGTGDDIGVINFKARDSVVTSDLTVGTVLVEADNTFTSSDKKARMKLQLYTGSALENVLFLDSDKSATFYGNVTIDGEDLIVNNTSGSAVITLHHGGTMAGSIAVAGGLFAGTSVSTDYDLHIKGAAKFDTINAATSDTDKFLVSDSGVLKYRTGDEVRADIGAGTVTQVATGSGLTGGTFSTAGTVSIDYTTGANSLIGSRNAGSPSSSAQIIYAETGGHGKVSFSDLFSSSMVAGIAMARDIPMVIHASLDDTTSTTGNRIIPLMGSISETTVSGAFAPHFFIIPYACVLKKVIFKNVSGSVSSGFTTELKAYKNGAVTGNSSSGELTHSSSAITWTPSAHSDITYAAGDKFSLVYQKSASLKTWNDVAVTIVFTLTDYDI